MAELAVLLLVFVAVAWCTWAVTPLIMQAGLERSEGRYVRNEAGLMTPIYRFTTPERLLRACWSAAILGGGLAGFILVSFNVLQPWLLAGVCLGAGLLAYQIPRLWLAHRIKTRKRQFEARLMDLTLGIASGLRAGAAFPQSLELVSRDMGGPIQEELGLVLHEYRLGVDLPDALARLCLRMPGEDLMLLVTSVRLTMQSGGSLAEVLDRITDTIRSRTEFSEKLRSMTAQGRFEAIAMAAAPLAAFGLLFMLDPELMKPMVQTQTGWCAIGVMLVLETVGFLVINKIVTIEV
ncbi:MAG: type II secretion system F family protein [Lentisphaeria bacterium]|jgi:tight adherence protein B